MVGVYIITNNINGKVYIGQSVDDLVKNAIDILNI
jgi:predicted GIY-YIG superfamily endonuclease